MNCRCGNELTIPKLKGFSICKRCRSVYNGQEFVGKFPQVENIKKLCVRKCQCGKHAIELIHIKEPAESTWACILCGRLYTIHPYFGLFIYPNLLSEYNCQVEVHNSGFILNKEKTILISGLYYKNGSSKNQIGEDIKYRGDSIKGYAQVKYDEDKLPIGVEYIPINIRTGEIMFKSKEVKLNGES